LWPFDHKGRGWVSWGLEVEAEKKRHSGISNIPSSVILEARQLTILTREDDVPIGTSRGGTLPCPRTDRYYHEVKRLAEERKREIYEMFKGMLVRHIRLGDCMTPKTVEKVKVDEEFMKMVKEGIEQNRKLLERLAKK